MYWTSASHCFFFRLIVDLWWEEMGELLLFDLVPVSTRIEPTIMITKRAVFSIELRIGLRETGSYCSTAMNGNYPHPVDKSKGLASKIIPPPPSPTVNWLKANSPASLFSLPSSPVRIEPTSLSLMRLVPYSLKYWSAAVNTPLSTASRC